MRVYLIGRIRDGQFESYRGKVLTSRSDAHQFLENQLTPRYSERDGWTVFEAFDTLETQSN